MSVNYGLRSAPVLVGDRHKRPPGVPPTRHFRGRAAVTRRPYSAAVSVSIIIPARNEEAELPATLRAAFDALAANGLPPDVTVVDDASTDRTAQIAADAGAAVVPVSLQNIAAVRNAGAAAAGGDLLVFVDADTHLPAETLAAILEAVARGVVGGGATLRWDRPPNVASRFCSWVFLLVWQKLLGLATGCLMFARRSDFEAVGGFDETYFAAEERFLTQALRRRGPFEIVSPPVVTSARKMRLFSTGRLIAIAVPALFFGRHRLKRRRGLELLYNAPREVAAAPDSPETCEPTR